MSALEPALHRGFLYGWIALAAITFVALFFVTAPYGRHQSRRLGPAIDATLGWAAAVFAVMTAYVREVGRAAGAPPDFSGPMAKPHRMFWMTMAALISVFDPHIGPAVARILDWAQFNASGKGVFIAFALWLILLGSIVTTFSRAARALKFLKKR